MRESRKWSAASISKTKTTSDGVSLIASCAQRAAAQHAPYTCSAQPMQKR